MAYIFVAVLVVVSVAILLWVFEKSDPAAIVFAFKIVLPVCLVSLGTIAVLIGRGQYGFPAILAGVLYWYFFLYKKRAR